jgi:hypothetical protein
MILCGHAMLVPFCPKLMPDLISPPNNGPPCTLNIINKYRSNITVYWVDSKGSAVKMTVISTMQTFTFSTFASHVWFAKSELNKHLLDQFVVPALDSAEWIVKPCVPALSEVPVGSDVTVESLLSESGNNIDAFRIDFPLCRAWEELGLVVVQGFHIFCASGDFVLVLQAASPTPALRIHIPRLATLNEAQLRATINYALQLSPDSTDPFALPNWAMYERAGRVRVRTG